ncbi:MAG TPA: cytochrome b/b6 domain-containing protein, partial [Candidatus Omnitrophota bacterium]|nr:cytochrome b/b6 domain-containing protein [Candidatus Omnitrophota bacterium]
MRDPVITTIPVWDLPVRLFHWLLVALIGALWASGEFGKLDLHMLLGKAALALIVFRLAWGVAGSRTARFTDFVKGPRAIAEYLRRPYAVVGHNPLGALSVLALLTL